ncbi:type II toxin-antitoxin system HicB family antitoxin [Massilia sp. IC2-476]|uniref:type II toxin-antitoxin system HicB family antitoxin n=1 Tax=Massilia sp. IC2-476 TaxID=2887199 RepID=UPI001D106B6D|nr:type II toxin-antitoxin system HicB family antitoxin [Massilia sp. IC2-476]MCC2972201.1 type II toxin-antitoxin system HicB family antitoxin [Massilia sp. IC2-476]
MKYPATFTPADEGGFVIKFRDIPEALTQGDDEAEALLMARDALTTSIDFYFEDQRKVPPPSKVQEGVRLVSLPLIVSAKILLLNAMLDRKVRPADLARLMGIKPQEVNRIIDLSHNTKIDTIADAMAALGCELDVVSSR